MALASRVGGDGVVVGVVNDDICVALAAVAASPANEETIGVSSLVR